MIGNRIIRLKETESTNRFASEFISKQNNVEEGTVIMANYQSAGRGAGENKWESEKDKNLTISIILYTAFLRIEEQFMVNKIVSLAVSDMITNFTKVKENVKIKWPNDIYFGNKKIAGILIENAIIGNKFLHFIIGIGININQEVFISDAPNPVSLKNITGIEYDPDECLSALCSCLDTRYGQLKNSENKLINDDYLSALFRINEVSSFVYRGHIIKAKITGLSDHGKLLLEKTDGVVIDCDFKEVEFILY